MFLQTLRTSCASVSWTEVFSPSSPAHQKLMFKRVCYQSGSNHCVLNLSYKCLMMVRLFRGSPTDGGIVSHTSSLSLNTGVLDRQSCSFNCCCNAMVIQSDVCCFANIKDQVLKSPHSRSLFDGRHPLRGSVLLSIRNNQEQ